MNKLKSGMQFLFAQNKIAVGIAILFSQFPALADIEWAIMNRNIIFSRALMGGLVMEMLSILIILPVLLLAFKLAGRTMQLLGNVPGAIIFFVAWLIAMYLDKDMSQPGHYTAGILIFSILFTLILSAILFVVKGKSPFFESRLIEPTDVMVETEPQLEAVVSGMFCENCGTQLSTESKFCSKCGHKIG